MKIHIGFFLLFISVSLMAQPALAATRKIDTTQTKVKWLGKKVTGAHWGHVNVKEGHLTFEKGKLVGGKFVMDMTSLNVGDIKDPDSNKKLEGHLKNDDFFAVDKFQTATLDIQKVAYKKGTSSLGIEGMLTIKRISRPISFEASLARLEKNQKSPYRGSAKITFNRAHYGIKYKSKSFFKNLGDKMIYDDVEVEVSLVTR